MWTTTKTKRRISWYRLLSPVVVILVVIAGTSLLYLVVRRAEIHQPSLEALQSVDSEVFSVVVDEKQEDQQEEETAEEGREEDESVEDEQEDESNPADDQQQEDPRVEDEEEEDRPVEEEQPEHPFSFRLRRSWLPGMAWEYSNKGWCLQCKMEEGQSDTCGEGHSVVLDRCTKRHPQRFSYEETSPGEGRLQPQSDRSLCFTWSDLNQEVVLQQCEEDNLYQIFLGFEPGHTFELQSKNDTGICLVVSESGAFTADECHTARQHDRISWEAVYQKGRYSGYVRPTEPCPRTCLDVFQHDKMTSVGQFRPVATSQGIDLFYQYNARNKYGYNGDNITPLDAETSIVFIHQDSMYCDLSLVTVHGAKELKAGQECTPGGALFYITGDLENSIVQDGRLSPSDTFTFDPATDETECDWKWSWQNTCEVRTDGLAHRWDPAQLSCIRIRPESFIGINQWMYVPGQEESDTPISFDQYVPLDMNNDLEICEGTCV